MELAGLKRNKDMGIKLSKQQKERLEKLEELESEHHKKIEQLGIDYNKNKELDQIDANEKAAADKEVADKKRLDDLKASNEKAAAYELEITSKLEDSNIDIMKEGYEKQLALINLEYQRKMTLIKGNTEKEIKLRENLEIEKYQRIAAISGNKAIEAEKLTGDGIIKIFEETQNNKSEILTNAENKLSTIINNNIQNERKTQNENIENFKIGEEKKQEILQQSVQLMGEIGNILFDYKKDQLSQEMSDLEHFYITSEEWSKMSAEDKRKNSEKQIISEKELSAKQLELKRKQAQADKNQSLFNIAMSTSEGAIRAVAASPLTGGMPFLAFVLAMGAIQAIAVASKPLPKYAKGRKSGQGEFAMVGELGPELMWIPQMAGIMPAHETQRALNGDTKLFDKWNMPAIDRWIPLPDISQQVNQIKNNDKSTPFIMDYDKIGKSVARNMPKNKHVTVNVDKSGISVEEGNTKTRILNKKYNG
mgnify:CR=1 FL=1